MYIVHSREKANLALRGLGPLVVPDGKRGVAARRRRSGVDGLELAKLLCSEDMLVVPYLVTALAAYPKVQKRLGDIPH
jgi:hypothetical protein